MDLNSIQRVTDDNKIFNFRVIAQVMNNCAKDLRKVTRRYPNGRNPSIRQYALCFGEMYFPARPPKSILNHIQRRISPQSPVNPIQVILMSARPSFTPIIIDFDFSIFLNSTKCQNWNII